jgi:5-methylcytosine-specific restriction protein B
MANDGIPAARKDTLVLELLRVLDEARAPLKRSEALRRVEERLRGTFTPIELTPAGPSTEEARWHNHLSWYSTHMRVAGWLDKTGDGWVITEEGRRALARYGEQPDGIAAESLRIYHTRQKNTSFPSRYAPILDAALELLEPGQWTSYSDLAAVASTNAQTVGSYMGSTDTEGAHRVLQKSGTVSPGFTWNDGRTDDVRDVLVSEGLRFDADGRADESQRVRAGDLREALEEAGILPRSARRAWFVRLPAAPSASSAATATSRSAHGVPPGSPSSLTAAAGLLQHWYSEGFVSLSASQLPDVEPGIGRDDLKAVIADAYSQSPSSVRAQKLDDLHAFLSRMRPDDLVVATDAATDTLRIGTITGTPDQYDDRAPGAIVRDVDWSDTDIPLEQASTKITSRFQIHSDIVEMTLQLPRLTALMEAPPAPATPGPPSSMADSATAPGAGTPHDDALHLPPATDKLADALTLPKEWLQECLDLLADRPQLILYGPPGTGKTYVAQALARHIAGDNVRLVQFHPAYSYEDFFEGYRPNPAGGFELRPGPLRKTVDAARENPGIPYVLIIDEINRGNLAKIFGELYFLLEYRDQNVDLLYASDDEVGFTLPDNVFLIGTMNTADRSIALVDAAMRRRFAFVPLIPGQAPLTGMLRGWLAKKGYGVEAADLLDELNARIGDPDFLIGPSYLMRPAVHADGGLERAWRTAILPLLEEHHFGEGLDVPGTYGLDVIRAAVKSRG